MKKPTRDDCTYALAWLYLLTFALVPLLMLIKELIFGR